MSYSVKDALADRKKERKKERITVEEALGERKKIISQNIASIVEGINTRYNSAVESYRKYSSEQKPTWGEDASKTYDKQREYYLRVSELKKDIDAYKKYLDTDTVNNMSKVLDDISLGYDNIYSNAKIYSKYKGEDEYNAALEQIELGKKALSADIPAIEAEIAEKQKLYDSAKEKKRLYDLSLKWYDNEGAQKHKEDLEALGLTLDGVSELESEILKKEQFLSQAKRAQLAVSLENDAVNSEDFEKNSLYVSSELPSLQYALQQDKTYTVGPDGKYYEDDIYEYINNPDKRAEFNAIGTTNSEREQGNYTGIYEEMGLDFISDKEKNIYNYYYSTQGREKAREYLSTIQESLNLRKAEDEFKALKNNTLLEMAFAVEAGLDQFSSGIQNLLNDDDYIPKSSTQYLSGMVREDLADDSLPVWYNFKTGEWEDKIFGNSVGQVGYDLINTTANMAPSILTSAAVGMISKTAGAAVGATLMGGSAAGNAYQEMLNLGYDKSQARVYSTLVGGSEAALSYALGGISKLGGKLSGNVISKAVSGVDNALARFAIKWGGSALSEGLEEGLQEVLNPIFKNLVLNTDENVNWGDVAYSALLGAMSAGILEGPATIASEISTYRDGRIIKNEGQADNLVKFAKALPVESVANQLAGRVNEKTGAYTIGRLLHEAGAQLSETNKADIVKSLERKGVTPKDAQTIAKWLNKAVEGETFSDKQVAALEENEVISKTFSDIVLNSNSSVNQRMYAFDEITGKYDTHGADASLNPTSQDVIQNVNEQSKDKNAFLSALQREYTGGTDAVGARVNEALAKFALESNLSSKPQNALESKFEASEDGQAYNKKTEQNVNVSEIASIKDGKMRLKLDSGEVVDAEDIEFATEDEAVIYSAILEIGNIVDAHSANSILSNYDSQQGISAGVYARGAIQAYSYGFYGYSPSGMMNPNTLSSELTETQRNKLYELGQGYAKSIELSEQAKAQDGNKNAVSHKVYFDQGNGKISEFDLSKAKLSDNQRAGVETAMYLTKLEIGADFYFFKSYEKNGKRIYRDYRGREVYAPNGIFHSDGRIYVDLNAGVSAKGLTLHTLSHELTHFIKEYSPQKYRQLAKVLIKEYEKSGADVNAIVLAKQKRLSILRKEAISYDEAFHEVVADSFVKMFDDGKMYQTIEKLKKIDKGIVEKIKEFFGNIANKIARFQKSAEAESFEGKYISDVDGAIERLRNAFAEALVDASSNFNNSSNVQQKNTTDNGDVKSSDRDAIELNESTLENLYSYSEKEDFFKDSNIYSYDFLINQRAMRVLKLPMLSKIYTDGKIDRSRIISEGKKNALSQKGSKKGANDVVYVKNKYTNKMIEVNNQSIRHGIGGKKNYMITNARLGLIIGDIIRNSIPINELKPSLGADSTYAMVAYAVSPENKPFLAISHIDIISGKLVDFETVGTVHSLKGRMKKGSTAAMNLAQGLSLDSLPFVASEISITQLLEFVNHVQQSILSEDVLARLGETRKPEGTYYGEVLHSDRDYSAVSNRSLLANALEATVKDDTEKAKLAEYKDKIKAADEQEAKLSRLNAEIKELSFSKGPRDKAKLRFLQDEAIKTANRIDLYDKQLLRLEAAKPLQNVLEREKQKAAKRQKAKDAEILKEYKEKSLAKLEETRRQYQESRKRNVEGRHKTEVRNKIKRVVAELNKLLLKPTKERHVPEELRVAVAEALDIVNMDTVGAEERAAKYERLIAEETDEDKIFSYTKTRDEILNQGTKLGEKITKLKNAYEQIKESTDGETASLYDEVILSKIEYVKNLVGNTSIRNMTLEQLEGVYELYTAVMTTVRDANKAFAENLKASRQELGSNTLNEIKSNNKIREVIKNPKTESFLWKNLKPMQAMKKIGSQTIQTLWNNILYGQETFARDYDEAVKFAEEMKEKYGFKNWDLNKLYSFESTSGKIMKVNLEQMMSIYAYSKRKQADDHIEKGGLLLNESIRKIKNKLGKVIEYEVTDANPYRLNKEQIVKIISALDKEAPGAIGFVDEMQKYLSETMGAKGNEVSMKLYGINLFKEEHYFPLKSSKEFMEAANAKIKGEVKVKNKGMTKATVDHANNPVVLENFLDVWGNHINDMSMYHGLVLPLEDFSRTMNYSRRADLESNVDAESVRTALENAFGKYADGYINELMKAINGGVLKDSTEGIADGLISRFKKAKVMASLSVIIQQPTAIIRSMGVVEPKYFLTPKGERFSHKKVWEELKQYCPTAIIKETGSFDTHMGKTIVDMVKGERTFSEKVGDVLGKAPAYADEMGWNMIWRALKEKVRTEQGLSGEELLRECGKQMTLIINETQVYDSVMSRSELMRSKSTFTKMMTSFMGEPTTVSNMIYGAALDFKRGNKKAAGRAVAATVASVVINGLASAIVYALRDDDEEKTLLEKYVSSATTEVVDGLNPITYVPFLKDIYSLIQGYDVERADMALISDVINAASSFYNVLDFGEYEGMTGEEIARHIYENSVPLLTSICDMFGLPVGNVLRDAEAIIVNDNLVMSKSTGAGIGLAIKEGLLDASPEVIKKNFKGNKYEKLYLLANAGDMSYVTEEVSEMVSEKVRSGKNEKEAKSAVRSSFTAIFKPLYVDAFKSGNYDEANRIRKLLYATGLYQNLSAVDAVLKKWRTE